MSDSNFWMIESIRLTLFPSVHIENEDQHILGWWKDVTGVEPESKNIQPRMDLVTISGVLEADKCNLSLNLKPDRIDWIIQPAVARDFDFRFVPNLGEADSAILIFNRLIMPWIENMQINVDRIAFGAKLIGNVDNKNEGYQKLAGFLPSVNIDPDKSTDFSFSINRPKEIKIHGKNICINRLSRWSFVEGMLIEGTIENNGFAPRKSNVKHNICTLELDINTQQDNGYSFKSDECKEIIKSLIDDGVAISNIGDQNA